MRSLDSVYVTGRDARQLSGLTGRTSWFRGSFIYVTRPEPKPEQIATFSSQGFTISDAGNLYGCIRAASDLTLNKKQVDLEVQ
jgi:hypothetical protein